MLDCFNSYLLQLCYVYSVGVLAACCYIDDLTCSSNIAYR